MASLVERLRTRTERPPLFDDDSDDDLFLKKKDGTKGSSREAAAAPEEIERVVREDAKEDSCQVCGKSGDLSSCETCTYAYHQTCLLPPQKFAPSGSWRCSECVNILGEVDKILDRDVLPSKEEDNGEGDDKLKQGVKKTPIHQYLVKWKGLSYIHCTWVPENEFVKAFKMYPRLRTKVNNFDRQMDSNNESGDDWIAIRPEWTTVDRVLASRKKNDKKEYFVKWKDLPYDECSWELESEISAFQLQIEKFQKHKSREHKSSSKNKIFGGNANELKHNQKEFQHYSNSPEFLHEGTLHPYQLEGLNFLRYSWSKSTHVILADEMGLGKTIQSIAFLASLFEEKITPHLVVAPLSTLRNWEREFATWAPHLNVIMYVGSSQARAIIREHEFFFPKENSKKNKKKKVVRESEVKQGKQDKQRKIKFDVLLTSYEMVNMDSTNLKPIKWECMIVDEGHRLKNKDSKLFLQLKLFSTKHRVLLTGTPLQNNLDELFMLMHFLDAGKFSSLQEFQEEFRDINQEEQISRLHKMLAPHLLRRVKKDVLKDMPPKKELILRVELSSKQKEYYKAILTRNYQVLARRGGAQISLINVVMELRKLCCHTYMLEGVEPDTPPEDVNEGLRLLLELSGKMHLLDKMMVKLKEQGHRVLIYSQFQHMLDLLEDYLSYRKWSYERIDGKIGGAERQIRIDRFNAKHSSRFCFLLSTRAGGLGINLATADTVIIYDSDWNPHADLQAMARAHRLGQTNKVMIYRLIARGTIEERMMQMTKKKMILEHLVVGRLKAQQTVNQEELDDIIRYGSKELFADENDDVAKTRQIHYDDAAIDRLLDREHMEDEVSSLDEEEDSDFLKAFKVANFEYIDEAEVAAAKEEEARRQELAQKASVANVDKMNYWEELLKDRYEELKVDEFTSLGKGKRSRKQMVASEEDELAGLEHVSSDEDYSYEDDFSDAEIPKKTQIPRKRSRVENSEPLPLMEGEGRSFRVLGFNQSQRAAFVKIIMRFGLGEFDWSEFIPLLKGKSLEEIKQYGSLFMSHIIEEPSDAQNFLDGVPKEGLRISEVLVRVATLQLIRDKVSLVIKKQGTPLFADDFLARFPLPYGRAWKEEHDILLLKAMLKHGYARWQAIVEDKDFGLAEVVRQELNLQVPGAMGGGSLINDGSVPGPSVDGVGVQAQGSNGNDLGSHTGAVPRGNSDVAKENQSHAMLYHLREMQRRMVEFIKKRVLLLEKNINAEEYLRLNPHLHFSSCEPSTNDLGAETSEMMIRKGDEDVNMSNEVHILEQIVPEDLLGNDQAARVEMAEHYNQMCKIVENCTDDAVMAFNGDTNASSRLRKNLEPLEVIYDGVHHILAQKNPKDDIEMGGMSKTSESELKSGAEAPTKGTKEESHIVMDDVKEDVPTDVKDVKDDKLRTEKQESECIVLDD